MPNERYQIWRILTPPAPCHALRPDHSRLGHQVKQGAAALDNRDYVG
jgi:hypothetical protein